MMIDFIIYFFASIGVIGTFLFGSCVVEYLLDKFTGKDDEVKGWF